jgi:hypothetical protein
MFNLNDQEAAEIFKTAIARIKIFLAKHEPPFIVTMTKSGELSRVK